MKRGTQDYINKINEKNTEIIDTYTNAIVNKEENNTDIINYSRDIDRVVANQNELILEKSEYQKIVLRDKLTNAVKWFIGIQLLFFNIIVLLIVVSVIVEMPIFKNKILTSK